MDKTAIVTGAAGLVGSEAVKLLIANDYRVIGIENDMRAKFFGNQGSIFHTLKDIKTKYDTKYFIFKNIDIRERELIELVFSRYKPELIIHTAAQPSHDWAASDPHTDFGVNAVGTLNLLQATRIYCPESTFSHISTSKVYGDTPNRLELIEGKKRYDLRPEHRYYPGIDTSMSVDQSTHSLFGVSKLSGDLLVQEFGRYFGIPTVCFRPGCVTGPAHAGVELHGWLQYLMKCTVLEKKYKVFGYKGKQVRCNIPAIDLANACLIFHENPKQAAVYNIGGGREANCSMLEAIEKCEEISGHKLNCEYINKPRIGDHIWWISNNFAFKKDYPKWNLTRNIDEMLVEIYDKLRRDINS